MQTPSADYWPGFAAARRRVVLARAGGWRDWLMGAVMYGLAALIAIVLLPLLLGIVLLGLVLVGIGRLRGLVGQAIPGRTPARDDEGRRNVRVLVRDA